MWSPCKLYTLQSTIFLLVNHHCGHITQWDLAWSRMRSMCLMISCTGTYHGSSQNSSLLTLSRIRFHFDPHSFGHGVPISPTKHGICHYFQWNHIQCFWLPFFKFAVKETIHGYWEKYWGAIVKASRWEYMPNKARGKVLYFLPQIHLFPSNSSNLLAAT